MDTTCTKYAKAKKSLNKFYLTAKVITFLLISLQDLPLLMPQLRLDFMQSMFTKFIPLPFTWKIYQLKLVTY